MPEGPASTLATDRRTPFAIVVAAAILAIAAGEVGRWIGAALLLWAGPTLLRPLARLPRVAALRPHVPLLLLGLLSIALLGDLMLGRPPATRDHGVHYFQTHILVNDLLPQGQLTGWSNRLNNGYPFGDSYPVFSYLWVGAIHLLSFGLFSLRTSYAWGLLAIWVISMWGIWQVTALVTTEIQKRARLSVLSTISPAWAGAIAAALWLIDPGYSRQGGWHYAMFHGVWPQLLSSALWVSAIPVTWRAFVHPSPRRIALAALVLGGSILAHPFGMLTAACSGLMWLLALWGTQSLRDLPPGAVRTWLMIHGAAALVTVGWVVGFLASADYMGRTPVPWLSLGELTSLLATGELFDRSRALVGPLAVIGLVLTARSGRVIAWLTLACLLAMLVASSEAAITVLRLDLLVSGFKNLQFPRYAMALKPMWFALAGIGAALVIAVLARRPPLLPRPSLSWGRLLACALFGPLLVAGVDDASRLVPRPAGSVLPLEGSRYESEEASLAAALVAERDANADRPLTVAFLRKGMGGGTYPLFSIADADARVILDGHIPGVNFRYRIDRRSVPLLRALGVTHVIHDEPLEDGDRALAEELDPVGTYGAYTLQRLRGPEPESDATRRVLVVEPDGVESDGVESKGVEVVSWQTEQIELDVPALPPDAQVELTLAPYRKWVPHGPDGSPLTIGVEEPISGLAGLTFAPGGPGRFTLRYEKLPRERNAVWVTIAALLACGIGLAFGKPLAMAERIHGAGARRIFVGLSLATVAVLVVGSMRRQQQKLADTWAPVLDYHERNRRLGAGVSREFVRDLVDARAYRVAIDPKDQCDGMLTKDSMPGCSQAQERPHVSMTYRSPFLYRCLVVTIPPRGLLEVRAEGLDPDLAVLGFFKRTTRGRGGDDLHWLVSGEERSRPARDSRRHFHAQPEDHQGTFTLSFSNENVLPEQVCVSLATAR